MLLMLQFLFCFVLFRSSATNLILSLFELIVNAIILFFLFFVFVLFLFCFAVVRPISS